MTRAQAETLVERFDPGTTWRSSTLASGTPRVLGRSSTAAYELDGPAASVTELTVAIDLGGGTAAGAREVGILDGIAGDFGGSAAAQWANGVGLAYVRGGEKSSQTSRVFFRWHLTLTTVSGLTGLVLDVVPKG